MTDLVTARLVLHPLTAPEARRVAARTPGPGDRWAPGYPGEGDAAGARLQLGNWAASGDPRPFGSYEIRRRDDGRAVGSIGFHGPPDGTGCATIGYGLVPSARGQGFASEALRALLDVAHASGVRRVRGDTSPDNVASQRVMAAAGMRCLRAGDDSWHYEVTWPGTGA